MDIFELSAVLGLDLSQYRKGLSTAMGLAGQFASWIGGITIDFGKDVLETGMGFDERMSAVQAVLGKEEGTLENMERLREYGLENAEKSIFTAEEVADAYYYMGMAGWKTEQMLAGLPGILNLAAASGEDLGRVSDIVTDSITAFGLTADDVNHYVDILAQTATNSNTDVRRMGETFKYVAPVAGALGYDVEDVALTIGLLASAGIKGSMAGTTLRNIFTRISTNAGATKKDLGALEIVADKLGVSFYDSAGRARDWGDVLNELREAWQGLGGGEQREIVDSFNESIGSAEEAELTFKEFSNDLRDVENWTRRLNEANDTEEWEQYAQQIQDTAGQYDNLLKLLDIPIPNSIEGYADALDLAQAKLGKLSDEEKIYYAKQIGSMRGMSGLLALLQSTDDQVGKLVKSYDNAKDAAEAMAGVRLDNLAGDIKLFNAAYDVLKIAVYDDVKGPLRELVQDGTGAIQRITDAINKDGLKGGIEQFAEELRNLSRKPEVKDALQAVGSLLGEVLAGAMDGLVPAAVEALENAVGALFTGGGEGLMKSGNPIIQALGVAVGSGGLATSLVGKLTGGIFDFIGKGIGQSMADEIAKQFDPTVSDNPLPINDWLTAGFDPLLIPDGIYNATETDFPRTTDLINDDLSSVGPDVGANLARDIASALFDTDFSIKVNATVYGLPGTLGGSGTGRTNLLMKNASAMNVGKIFKRSTVFGFDDGKFQIAGDAGDEAVVGVNSLNRMIQNAVDSAIPEIEPVQTENPYADIIAAISSVGDITTEVVNSTIDAGNLISGTISDINGAIANRTNTTVDSNNNVANSISNVGNMVFDILNAILQEIQRSQSMMAQSMRAQSTIEIDGARIARAIMPYMTAERQRVGASLAR